MKPTSKLWTAALAAALLLAFTPSVQAEEEAAAETPVTTETPAVVPGQGCQQTPTLEESLEAPFLQEIRQEQPLYEAPVPPPPGYVKFCKCSCGQRCSTYLDCPSFAPCLSGYTCC